MPLTFFPPTGLWRRRFEVEVISHAAAAKHALIYLYVLSEDCNPHNQVRI